jgi:single-strand DNA-binding protein
MANLNKVFLIGRLTRDPELRYTTNGAAVTSLGLAVNRFYNSKDGERREEVTFLDVTVWNRQAENCCQYLKKGRPVHVEGYLKLDSWDDKETGKKRSTVKIEAENVQFLDGRGSEGGGDGETDFRSSAPRETARPAAGNGPSRGSYPPPVSEPAPARRSPAPPDEMEDDDIPF